MKAVIYARYSSHNQREESIEDQVRVCQEEADKYGDEVVAVYFDKAISGTTSRRPAFQALIADSRDADWTRVWVYKTDRFARDRYVSAVCRHNLRRNGVEIKTAAEPIPDGPMGVLVESLMEGMAEYYSANLSENVKRGHKGNALKCHHNGVLRYGYDLMPDGSYSVNEREAEVIRLMYQLRADGATVRSIDMQLEQRGILTRSGARMSYQTVSRLLKNEAYKGVYKYGGVRIEKGMPAIVTPGLWDAAQNPNIPRPKNKKGKKRKWVHDIKGMEFGYLVPIEVADITPHHHYKWLCECRACGGTKVEWATRLTSGIATHCGCLSTCTRKRENGRFVSERD